MTTTALPSHKQGTVHRRPGATRAARRQRDVIDELTRGLGHQPDAAEKLLIQQAAGLVAAREAMQQAALRGEPVSADALIKVANSATRTLTALRGKRGKRPIDSDCGPSTLDRIIAVKRGAP